GPGCDDEFTELMGAPGSQLLLALLQGLELGVEVARLAHDGSSGLVPDAEKGGLTGDGQERDQ
ncbi:hypothetical protein KZY98_15945, partial [Croceibacter atlanticus]|nr:hypothetical protein [Croceibacter atlanticus]